MGEINTKEIQNKIDNILSESNVFNYGVVTRINEFVIESTSLTDGFYFEKVFVGDSSNVGYIDKIESNKTIILLIKKSSDIKIGDKIILSGEVLKGEFSDSSCGKVIDLFGNDLLFNGVCDDLVDLDIETDNIPIMDRTSVSRPLLTGISAIDLMFPIGRGQRQLIVGDKKTGKTQLLLDTIYNQREDNIICIYVAIGKTLKEIKKVYKSLLEKGCSKYTIVLCAFNDDPQPLIKLMPYFATSIAERYMMQSKDVLICVDDLKKHADVCRQIALMSGKNTGRDIYPADIFYSHSRFLEKGCQHKNGGSISILPVVETKGGDISDYITTNIISITDGQIVLSDKLYKKGIKPAINAGLSVSRLGGAVQNDIMREIGAKVRRELLSFLEVSDTYQLVKEESLTPELQFKMKRGRIIQNLLKQYKFSGMTEAVMYEKFSNVLSLDMNNIDSVDENGNIIKVETEPVSEEIVKENTIQVIDNNIVVDVNNVATNNDNTSVVPSEVPNEVSVEVPNEVSVEVPSVEVSTPVATGYYIDNSMTNDNDVAGFVNPSIVQTEEVNYYQPVIDNNLSEIQNVEVPASEIAVPAEPVISTSEVVVPVEPVMVPTSEVVVPVEPVMVPTSEVVVPVEPVIESTVSMTPEIPVEPTPEYNSEDVI